MKTSQRTAKPDVVFSLRTIYRGILKATKLPGQQQEVLNINLTTERDGWLDAHLGALAGCDVKDEQDRPHVLTGAEVGQWGRGTMGDRDVYEAKSTGFDVLDLRPILPL